MFLPERYPWPLNPHLQEFALATSTWHPRPSIHQYAPELHGVLLDVDITSKLASVTTSHDHRAATGSLFPPCFISTSCPSGPSNIAHLAQSTGDATTNHHSMWLKQQTLTVSILRLDIQDQDVQQASVLLDLPVAILRLRLPMAWLGCPATHGVPPFCHDTNPIG